MHIALITGASSGMGRDFVSVIDREYSFDEIWVVARRKDRLESLSAVCRNRIRPVALDLCERGSVAVLSSMLSEASADVSILVNAAGSGIFGSFSSMTEEEVMDMCDLNLRALSGITRAVLPFMKEGSSIINLASNSSWQPVPYIAMYGATKAAVLSLSRALSVELRERGIHVMAVCPGWIQTEFFDHAVRDNTIKYYDKIYPSMAVVEKAMKDLKKKRMVSILGFRVRMQVRLVKFLPVKAVMRVWCSQQGK